MASGCGARQCQKPGTLFHQSLADRWGPRRHVPGDADSRVLVKISSSCLIWILEPFGKPQPDLIRGRSTSCTVRAATDGGGCCGPRSPALAPGDKGKGPPTLHWLMASPAAAPAEFKKLEAARQSLIAISQSAPEIRAPAIRPSKGGMENGQDGVAEQRNRAKLISISNQSPDARPMPCPPKNGAA
ncbi:hypothetical protein U9M48_033617 [Paspalum notatum var. saurae]|uniref:Uncharacterized protein n=1 Tax=Paspalum notatum var. saurae TaxID=547442 RepID=A0AAQ3UAI9_PASNO